MSNEMLLNIKTLRERAGLKQMEAAAAVGVKPPTFCAWEAGACFPSADKLPALARVLGCTIDELYDIGANGEEINAVAKQNAS
jgi:DNA-binding XRE family transcriptional regulator